MSDKIYVSILKWGSVVSLFSVFLVFKNLLFPFITSKQIFFNVLIEILLIFWVALIVKYPEYRPKKSYITFGLLAYFVIITLSCFTGVDFNLSFWGDIERMLGVFHLFHFLGLYFIIITVFRDKKDWHSLFLASIIIAFFECAYGLTQGVRYSTLGNAEYIAAYCIFNIYFCFLLFAESKNKSLSWLYLLPLPIFLWQFKIANISGAFVGLGFSVIAAIFLYALLLKNKKLRISFIALFVVILVATVFLFINKDKDWVKTNSYLNPISDLSLKNITFQTRLISWRAAGIDFENHPLLGTGYGNFSISFDKYFDPKFYNYTRGETYFDKAHNNIVEVASTTGSLGLITYLSIFLAAAYYLIFGYYRKKITLHQFVIISCLITAYFVHNLAVFDALVTYIALMMVLAYVYWLGNREDGFIDEVGKTAKHVANVISRKESSFSNSEIYALVIAGVILLTIAYQYNYRSYKMLDLTIDGQRAFMESKVAETVDIYKEALSLNTVLDRDSRSSLINLFISNPAVISNAPAEKREEILNFLIEIGEKNVKYNPHDSLMQMMLSQVYNLVAMYYAPANGNQGNLEKFYDNSDKAIKAIDASIDASPGRVPIYFQKAQALLTRGDRDKAIETLKFATTLNPDYPDSFCYLGRAYILLGQEQEGYEEIGKCLDLPVGTDVLSSAQLIGAYIQHFEAVKDTKRVTKLYELLTSAEANNTEYWVSLANLYKERGDNESARRAAEKAIEINPSIAAYAQEFIDNLGK